MLVAGAAGQVNVIVNTNFATGLQEGSVSWLSYAFRLFQLPVGVLAVGIGTASLDALTKAFAGRVGAAPDRHSDPVNSSFQSSLEHTFWVLAPAFIFLYLGSTNLVSLVFEAGKFSSNDKIMTAAALQAYALGLIGYGLLKLMNSYFYAAGQTKWPMWIGIGSVALNYVLNALFVEQYLHVGLAMTASLVLTLNSALLMLLAYRQGLRIRWTPLLRILGWMMLAGAAACVGSEVVSNEVIGDVFGISQLAPGTLGNKIISALSLSVIGFMIVVVVVFASGSHSRIIASFKAKFR
jgi:putative peptidoglycan lipid II flippase